MCPSRQTPKSHSPSFHSRDTDEGYFAQRMKESRSNMNADVEGVDPHRRPFHLDVVNESAMAPDLDRAIRILLCDCFPPDVEVFSRTRHWHGSAPDYSVVCLERGALVGHVGIVLRMVSAGGS